MILLKTRLGTTLCAALAAALLLIMPANAAIIEPSSKMYTLTDTHKGPGKTGDVVYNATWLMFDGRTTLTAEFLGGWQAGEPGQQGWMSLLGANYAGNKVDAANPLATFTVDRNLGYGGTNWLSACLVSCMSNNRGLAWLPTDFGGYLMFDDTSWSNVGWDGYHDFDDVVVKITDQALQPPSPVPLPAGFLLLASGLTGLLGWARFKKGNRISV